MPLKQDMGRGSGPGVVRSPLGSASGVSARLSAAAKGPKRFPYRQAWWKEWNSAFGTRLTEFDALRIRAKCSNTYKG
jgi:hypothetical protein